MEGSDVLAEVGWVWPAYMQIGAVEALIDDLAAVDADDRASVLEEALPRFYTPGYLARMLVDRYSVVPAVRGFTDQIAEAIEAAQLGLDIAAVSTLVPVVEGIIREAAAEAEREVGTRQPALKAELGRMIEREKQEGLPGWEERAMLLEELKRFFEDELFEQTDDFEGLRELNRHGIAHALFKDFGSHANFCIAISIIDHLTFMMACRTDGMSLFAPGETEESRRLSRYYEILSMTSRLRPGIGL